MLTFLPSSKSIIDLIDWAFVPLQIYLNSGQAHILNGFLYNNGNVEIGAICIKLVPIYNVKSIKLLLIAMVLALLYYFLLKLSLSNHVYDNAFTELPKYNDHMKPNRIPFSWAI